MNKITALSKKRLFTRAYIYVMLIAYPLFTGFKGYSALTDAKLAFFIAATALWLLSLLAVSIKYRPSGSCRPGAAHICLAAYFIICCASALFSPYKSAVLLGAGRFDGLLSTALHICIFLGVSRYARPERGYAYALAISMTACCIVAVLQLFDLNPLKLFPSDYVYSDMGTKYSGEFLGTIGNANLFSAYLALCLPIVSGVFICGRQNRGFLLPVMLLGAFCLFACTVSAGKLALVLTMLIATPFIVTDAGRLHRWMVTAGTFFFALYLAFGFNALKAANGAGSVADFRITNVLRGIFLLTAMLAVLTYFFRGKNISRGALQSILAALSVLAAAAGLFCIYNFSGSEGTIYELSRVLHGELSESFGSSRILIWRDCLGLVAERPILGGGPGTVSARLDIHFSRFVEETGRTLSSRVDNAHNVYLGILADTGAFSLAACLAAMAAALVNAVRSAKTAPLALIFSCGLLAYWIQDFFGLGLFIVSPLMWIIWGLVAEAVKRNN